VHEGARKNPTLLLDMRALVHNVSHVAGTSGPRRSRHRIGCGKVGRSLSLSLTLYLSLSRSRSLALSLARSLARRGANLELGAVKVVRAPRQLLVVHVVAHLRRKRIFVERMTSDSKLKAASEGSK